MYRVLVLILILSGCLSCKEKEYAKSRFIIPVEKAIGTGEILNLSDYAKSIKYIPLETTDSVLVGNIECLIYEQGKFVLKDFQNGMAWTFGESGKFLCQIGNKGGGPREYLSVRNMNIVPHTEKRLLFLDTYPRHLYIYDLDGFFYKEISYSQFPDTYSPWQTIAIDTAIFFSNLTSPKHLFYRGMFFTNDSNQSTTLFYNYVDKMIEGKQTWGGYEKAYMWNYRDTMRYYRILNDTVFTLTQNRNVKPQYIFSYGSYKAEPNRLLTHGDLDNCIHVDDDIFETSKYLFLSFDFHKNAPEHFSYERINPRTGKPRKIDVRKVYGLFEKETGRLTLLNQPVKHKYLGFRNDLDGGPCFWPKYISSKDEMVTWWMADEFLKIYESLPNPSAELREVAENLNPDDNPVLMVVQLK